MSDNEISEPLRRLNSRLMVQAIPLHSENVVTMPKDPAFIGMSGTAFTGIVNRPRQNMFMIEWILSA
jgi:hypothetical protein